MSSATRNDGPTPVGLTRDAGFEIGVSRTVGHPLDAVWRLLLSPTGTAVWIGPGVELGAAKGDAYRSTDGTAGELRSLHDRDRVRLTYQPTDRDEPTIVQLTVRAGADSRRTSIRFHQERLASSAERDQQRTHWQEVLSRLEDLLDG